MKHLLKIGGVLCLLLFASAGVAWGEVIRLKSGKVIEGIILFEDEEVVVIRDAKGVRYQYPKSELEEPASQSPIKEDHENKEQRARSKELSAVESQESETEVAGRKVSLGISMFGGGMVTPWQVTDSATMKWGGHAGGEVMIGSRNLFHRRIFLGGSVGFHAYMPAGQVVSFIPIKLRAEVPLTLTRHAPMLGMGVGYGIGLQHHKGGFCADVSFGWRYAYSRKGAFFMGVFADVQGTEITVNETILGTEYTSLAHRNLCGFGAKMALFF